MIKKFTRSEVYPPAYNNWSEEKRNEADLEARPLDVKINEWISKNSQFRILNAFVVKENSEAWVVYTKKDD